jgi:[amino-group carrier protein]-gamma-(L-lysyl/L-ornithyl)-L-glutamate aminotransferase
MDDVGRELRYTSGVYAKRRLVLVRGQGAHVWDDQGRRYVDCAAGIGVAALGHAHPAVVEAIAGQAATLLTCSEGFFNDRRAALLERLVGLAPAGIERAFLCNSGTEAIEGAIKFARLATRRTGVVAAERGFHGRTLGALSATWEPAYREPFRPLVPGFRHVPYDDLAALDGAVGGDTAAVILEVVQGEGGVRPGSAEFLRGAQALCRERGALFVLDEIQTGLGRTGRLFAAEHHDLAPDLICLAKPLAGGVPIGAILIGERVGELPKKVHGSTFGGNPLACAAALAALDVVERERLPERAARLGAHALERLRALRGPTVREARGLGLMLGLELAEPVEPCLTRLAERGVLALQAGANVLRLLPPLVIAEEDLDAAVDAVAEVVGAAPA